MWARSNIGPQDARWKTFCFICQAWQIAPLPLCPDVVEKVAASFKAGGYRSGKQYFSSISAEPAANISSSCRQRVLTLQSAPARIRGALRTALRTGLRLAVHPVAPEDAARGWKAHRPLML